MAKDDQKEWRDDVTPDKEAQEAERKRAEKEADPENEDAVKAAKERVENYVHSNVVQGYGRQDDGYGGPYHPDAFHDPQIKFALGGAPEAQANYTQELYEADKKRAEEGGIDKVDLVAASAHSTVVEEQPYRAAAETIEVEATHDNVAEAAARKHFITPRSDESNDDAISRVLANDRAAAPAKDAQDAPERGGDEPERNTAGTEDEDSNSPGDGDKTGSNAPAKKAPAKKAPAKKAPVKKAPAKKTTARRQPKFDDK